MFLVFLSFPLLGFPVTSSHCGLSRLLMWSLFLSVPRFLCLGGSSSVLLGGVPPSPPVHRLSLGWPPRSISLLQLSLCSVLGGVCSSSFPPTRLWSSRLAFCSVTVPLVFSWLLLVYSYLLSPVGLWVLQVLSVLACPWVQGCSSQCILVLCLRLSRFGFLPCFLSCSSGVFRPGGCFPLGGLLLYGCIGSLIPRSSAVVLSSVVCLLSSFPTLVVVLFIPPSSFRTPSVSVGCVPSAFAMGSP